MCDYVVLPLLNSSFEPGRAREVVEGFEDVDVRSRGGICPAGLLS